MAKRSHRILGLAQIKGRQNEDRVESILQELIKQGEIDHYYRCEPEKELDRMGIDFLVYPDPDWCIPLQVKSSLEGKEEHLNKYPRIPCLVVKSGDADWLLLNLTLSALGLSTAELVPSTEAPAVM